MRTRNRTEADYIPEGKDRASRASIDPMKLVEALYEKGLLRPAKPLALRPGERVNLILVRQPDPKRWDLARLAKSRTAEDLELAERGLAGWSVDLDKEDR